FEPDQVEADESPDGLEQAGLELDAEPVAPASLPDLQLLRHPRRADDHAPAGRVELEHQVEREAVAGPGIAGPDQVSGDRAAVGDDPDNVLALARSGVRGVGVERRGSQAAAE